MSVFGEPASVLSRILVAFEEAIRRGDRPTLLVFGIGSKKALDEFIRARSSISRPPEGVPVLVWWAFLTVPVGVSLDIPPDEWVIKSERRGE